MAEQQGAPTPPPPPLSAAANSSTDNTSLGGFTEFIRTGDAATPVASPAVMDATATNGTRANGTSSNPPPDSNPADPSAAQAQESPGFFSGLIRKASSALESTIETARREVQQNEVLASAQETLTEFSNVFNAPQTRGAGDQAGRRVLASTDGPYAPKTKEIKSLRTNTSMNAVPLLMFVGGEANDLVIVTEHSIEAFGRDGTKILQANFAEQQDDGAGATTEQSSSTPIRRSRVHSRPQSGAIAATCAVYLKNEVELAVGHVDGTVKIYSLRSGRMGMKVRSGAPMAAAPTCLACMSGARMLVGCNSGMLTLTKVGDLSDIAWLHAPEACETPLGSGSTSAPVLCVAPVERGEQTLPAHASCVVGYANGTIWGNKFDDPLAGMPFAAHGGKVSGLVTFFNGNLVVSIGDEEDKSLSASVKETGRCLLRRVLPYTPTCIGRVEPARVDGRREDRWICASENVLLVGGEEGQVDVFRVIPLSARRVEFRLVRRMSERTRGRKRGVVSVVYMESEATLHSLSRSGEVRRWHLCREDAWTLATPEERMRAAPYDTTRATKVIGNGGEEDGVDTRLAVGEGVITAQRVLAMVQEDNTGLDEEGKDRVVEEFQKKQAEMQDKAEQADNELRRAKRRIARRFQRAVDGTEELGWEKRMGEAARRVAAFELNFVVQKHSDTMTKIRGDAVEKLSGVLLKALDGARGAPENVVAVRHAVNELARIPTDTVL